MTCTSGARAAVVDHGAFAGYFSALHSREGGPRVVYALAYIACWFRRLPSE